MSASRPPGQSSRQQPVLCVAPYRGPDPIYEAIGATVLAAADCGHKAWLSPQGAAKLAEDAGIRTECTLCMDPERMIGMQLVPGALAAAESVLSPTESARMRRFMNLIGAKEPR